MIIFIRPLLKKPVYSEEIILLSLFPRIRLAPWESPCVLRIIIKGPNKDNPVQVSPWARERREEAKGRQEERNRRVAQRGYARHSDSIRGGRDWGGI